MFSSLARAAAVRILESDSIVPSISHTELILAQDEFIKNDGRRVMFYVCSVQS